MSIDDPSGGKASYWLRRAARMLDCAVQCCGTEDSEEIDRMERRCDELAVKLERGSSKVIVGGDYVAGREPPIEGEVRVTSDTHAAAADEPFDVLEEVLRLHRADAELLDGRNFKPAVHDAYEAALLEFARRLDEARGEITRLRGLAWEATKEIRAECDRLREPDHRFEGDPWGPCVRCDNPAHHPLHREALGEDDGMYGDWRDNPGNYGE